MSKDIRESYDSYEEYFLDQQRVEEEALAEMAPEVISEPESEKQFLHLKTVKGGEKVKKDFTCKLSPGEKKFARTLYSRWTKKEVISGHKDDLCKIGGCKPIALKTLTKRGLLEEKGGYYIIISQKFEEL